MEEGNQNYSFAKLDNTIHSFGVTDSNTNDTNLNYNAHPRVEDISDITLDTSSSSSADHRNVRGLADTFTSGDREEKPEAVGNRTYSTQTLVGTVQDIIAVKSCQSITDRDPTSKPRPHGTNCPIKDSGVDKRSNTKGDNNVAAENLSRHFSVEEEDMSVNELISKEQSTEGPRSKGNVDCTDSVSTRNGPLSIRDRDSTRRDCAGSYSLASPISEGSHVVHAIHGLTSEDQSKNCSSGSGTNNLVSNNTNKALGGETPSLYANISDTSAIPLNQVYNPYALAHHIASINNTDCQHGGQPAQHHLLHTTSKQPCHSTLVIGKTQAESSCSCLRISKGEQENRINNSTAFGEASTEEETSVEMDSTPTTRPAMSSAKHYYNSGSALFKPFLKRMSMLAKSSALKNWAANERTSKPFKDKNENRSSNDWNKLNGDGGQTTTAVDLSLPPRFSQIDSYSHHPLLRLPHQDFHGQPYNVSQGSDAHLSPHFPHQHHQAHGGQQQFINVPHAHQQDRYVLHQSCSGFSLNQPFHTAHHPLHQQRYPYPYIQQQHQQQQQLQQQQQQQQQQQEQLHHIGQDCRARRLSTESQNSLLQVVKCGRNRYRISPVSLLWTFLSILLAGSCALCFATPYWMVHSDHVHSFGLFNICVRDRRFAMPRPACIKYSQMPAWHVNLPFLHMSSASASESIPSSSARGLSSENVYSSNIPHTLTASKSLQKRSQDYFGENTFRRSLAPHYPGNYNNNGPTRHGNETFKDPSHKTIFSSNYHNRINNNNNKNQNSFYNGKQNYNNNAISNRDINNNIMVKENSNNNRNFLNPSSSDGTRFPPAAGGKAGESGYASIPPVAWQAACLLFGAGVGVQVLGAAISLVTLGVTDPFHRRLASINGYLQAVGVLLLASGLLLFPAGFGSSFYHHFCGSEAAYNSGHCTMGWSYVIAIMATALSVFCPVMSSFAEAQQRVIGAGVRGGDYKLGTGQDSSAVP